MGPPRIIVADPLGQAAPQFRTGLERVQVDTLVFQAAPQPLDEHVVHPTAFAVHRYPYLRIPQDLCELRRGELAALVGVENLRPAVTGQGVLQRLDAEPHIHRVRYTPRQHLARPPVHDRDKIQKPASHRNVGEIRAPDLVRPVDRQVSEQIRVDPMLRMRDRRAWPLVDRYKAHYRHQSAHALAVDLVTFTTQMPRHLPRSIPG